MASSSSSSHFGSDMPTKTTEENTMSSVPHPIFGLRENVATPGLVHVFMDVSFGGESGRLVFRLFQERVPRTVENFRQLCVGKLGKHFSFAGSQFHRLIPGFMIQGGDWTKGDGTGGRSIYTSSTTGANTFEDESVGLHEMRHNKRGILSMANKGPDTNSSQFFLLFQPQPHLDGRHVVFGELVEGMRVLDALERVRTAPGDRPLEPVTIDCCGEVVRVRRTFRPLSDDKSDMLQDDGGRELQNTHPTTKGKKGKKLRARIIQRLAEIEKKGPRGVIKTGGAGGTARTAKAKASGDSSSSSEDSESSESSEKIRKKKHKKKKAKKSKKKKN
ncbi:unnamed protein product [Amoebophrya sp. A25]|nr:unnamed protein product [Amoebophrya sp. A25]|eukprot:GSA25T00010724001.1